MTRRERLDARERAVGSKLPYARLIDDETIELDDGGLLQTIEVQGFLFETADAEELNYRKSLRDAVLRAIGSSQFAIHHHIVRRRVGVSGSGTYPDAFSARLNRSWHDRLASRELFTNHLFLSVVRRAPGRRGSFIERLSLRAGGRASRAAEFATECRALRSATDQLIAALGQYRPRLLSVYEYEPGFCSEPLEFLSLLLDGELRPVRLPEGRLGDYLPGRRISFGQNLLEHAPTGALPRRFTAMLSIKDYPGQTSAGMLDNLLRLPLDLSISQSFAFVDRGVGLNRMNLALRRMRATDDEAISLRSDLSAAKDELAAGRAAFGEHHLTIAVHGTSLERIEDDVAEIQAAITDTGMIAVREDIGLEAAWWAQFPGNFPYIARRALISSSNFASFASCHNFPIGRAVGNHWGDAVSVLETTAAGPYHFNFHRGDLGNFTIIGPSGSGKTVVLNFLLAQARKFSPRIVFFDKDRGAELFVRAIGGAYHVLRPGSPSGLNPLLIEDTPENRRFLTRWIARLSGTAVLDTEELGRIHDAIDACMSAPPAFRRLRHFVDLLRGGHRPRSDDLWSRLKPWWGDGEHAWLFDNSGDLTGLDRDTVGFDMTLLLDLPSLRTPAMMYLFHRVEERLDGAPAIIVIDEGWKALDDEVFVQQIRDWEKTIRKRNGIVGFATQSAEDALSSRISSAIIEQAATQIFMANPKARPEDYCDGFGLTAHELDLVRTLPDAAHCFLIKHGTDSVVARLNLSNEPELLTILSGRERTVRLLDAIREEVGDDPADWLPQLLKVA